MAKPTNTRAAFTLVELLVVIAIIALLLSMTMPGLMRAKDLTRVTICASNLSAVGRGVRLYMTATESIEPWRWCDGGYDNPWEWARGRLDSSGRLVPRSWGNPATALTKDFGPRTTVRDDRFAPHANPQQFLDTAEAFFCPAASYSYEKHYRRHGLLGLPLDTLPYVWGTYQWNYHIERDAGGRERSNISPQIKDVLMLDFAWYGGPYPWEQFQTPSFWHYNVLLLDSSVHRLPDETKKVWELLFGPQPSGDRRVRDFSREYTLRQGVH